MLKKSQVGTAIEIIGGLLIGALIIFLFIRIYAAIMGQGDNYYNEFIKEIDNLKDKPIDEAKNTIPIVLDDGAGIIGFNADSNDITIRYKMPRLDWEAITLWNPTLTFYKPSGCQQSKSCSCYCPSFELNKDIPGGLHIYYTCKNARCKNYNNIQFKQNNLCKEDYCLYESDDNGIVFIKNLNLAWALGDIGIPTTQDDKWQQAAFEKIGNKLVICNNFPCSQSS